jgi:catechol 2,3-dioxygenase-like lactoylglutathione lyase family enzyme
VRDTEDALRFYRDGLGLTVLGHSENYGIEQERLNNVFGARLKITALRAQSGPAIEFLEYLTPGTARPVPADTGANDLWYWPIRMRGQTLDMLSKSVATHGGSLVSPGVVKIPEDAHTQKALHERGPTGHALLIHDLSTDRDEHQ